MSSCCKLLTATGPASLYLFFTRPAFGYSFLLSRPAFLPQTETSVETFLDRTYCIIKESLNPGQNGFVAALCFSRPPLPPRPEVPLSSHSIPCTALVVLKAIDKHTHAEEATENKLHHTKREFKLLQWATPML
jgi:hypothetical protein